MIVEDTTRARVRTADVGGGIELAYETCGDPTDPTILLVMGLGMQMLAWDEDFCEQLVGRGYHVVRFDNRDIGLSTKVGGGPPNVIAGALGLTGSARYTLTEMAADAAGLLDRLGVDRAHLVGASMGGMIAQTAAINHPDRVLSLTSIMSTTGSRRVGHPSYKTFGLLLAKPPREREAAIERVIKTFKVIGSPGFPFDEKRVREIAGRSFDRGHSQAGIARQLHAITASGDRTPGLRQLDLPALVIHGANDVLVNPSGGRATAKAIPGARLKMVDGMGHDLPRALWPEFAEDIAATAARAPAGAPEPVA